MNYYVNMQQTDFFGFAHSFTAEDASAIRSAILKIRFELSNGFGTLGSDGDVNLTFGVEGKCRTYDLNHAELLRQFDRQDLGIDTDDE